MADRLALIMQLGALATDAAQRGDDRAAAIVRAAAQHLMDMHADLQSLQRRREKDRTRKHSADSAESTDSVGGSQGFSPTPPFPNSPKTTTTTTPREREHSGDLYAESVENLTGLLHTRFGDELWPDIDGFLRRREYATWAGWMKEMLSCMTGGQAMECDVAQVCRDDAALERKIGSPKGLRTFVASAARDRLTPKEDGPRRPPFGAGVRPERPSIGARAFATTLDAIKDL